MDVKITIEVSEQEQKDILIANLSELKFVGFEEEERSLIGYISRDDYNKEGLNNLLNEQSLKYSESVVEDRNWNEVWESSFSPVIVEDFCLIRADFHSSIKEVEHEIIITPKMSFGTGHHATTYMMIQQMRDLNFKNKRVADFGTGTGILSILAEKLGAETVWAVDNDIWSINNANENVARNSCSKIQIELANEFSPKEKFDLVLANINRNIILSNFDGLVLDLRKMGIYY